MKLGFLGFGEVAFELSRGLGEEGLHGIIGYDPMQDDPKYGSLIRKRAEAARVTLLDAAGLLVNNADVIIAAVPGTFALQAAEGIVGELNDSKIYADISTSAPAIKKKIATLVAPTGAAFVDGALMGRLTAERHKVPILVSGSGSNRFIELLTPYGASLQKVSDMAGDAIAVKLVRSIYIKGIVSLQVEMLSAAMKLQVEDLALESISHTLNGAPFVTTMNVLLPAGAIHAERQFHEMEDCMVMLKELGIDPIMTEATTRHLRYLANKNLKDSFKGELPSAWEDILRELV